MGQYFEYFAATAEEAAACVPDGPTAAGHTVCEVKGIDPVVVLGELFAHARGEDGYDLGRSLERWPVERRPPEGDAELVRVHDGNVAALASVPDERLPGITVRWAAGEYWVAPERPEELAPSVAQLRDIAVAANRPGHGMYAWWLP
ncbi:hypothetical protein [Streptomyces sp. SM12]|uniref:hypothetical protein n=1 Tax=Streptomyces sp. SM12 TaxID=1071602 RepID=UPI000CD56E7E|nr:hypothetical protein [Streptomyces sp. SM12]